jgi:transposase
MALRQGNREQMQFLPPSIEQYISAEAPVRVYDAFVEALDLNDLGIKVDPEREGNPQYDPRSMLKLLVYGYSYGVRSSRKLERETCYNLSFIWLMGGLKPDHKTIAEFRRRNKEALRRALGQCARLCLKLDLIAGNVLFVDGTKIRGNSALKNSWNQEKGKRVLAQVEQRIEEVLREAEARDAEEEGEPSLVSLPTQLLAPNALKDKIEHIMDELKASGKPSFNTTDRECASFNGIHGAGAGYNAEVVVDDRHGLIVSADAVSAGNDEGQMSGQIEQAQAVLGRAPEVAVADAGFSDMADLRRLDEQNIRLLVPNRQMVHDKKIGEFDKKNFQYLAESDCYICPQGHKLRFVQIIKSSQNRLYTIKQKADCLNCSHYGKCTKSKSGRKLERLAAEELRIRLEQVYALPENKVIYRRRQAKIELVFGHFKKNLGMNCFLLRGVAGARAEISLLALCFNVRRMITLLGHEGLIRKFKELMAPNQSFLRSCIVY